MIGAVVESLVLFFTTNRVGRVIAGIGAFLLMLGIGALSVFSAGKKAAQAEQDKESLKALRQRNEIDADVSRAAPDDVDRRLDDWVRPQ